MSAYSHLAASAFLGDAMAARAIDAAIRFGLIDLLAANNPVAMAQIVRATGNSPTGAATLVQLLENCGVVETRQQLVALTARFRAILPFRDYLETRLRFADLVWPDIQTLLPSLLANGPDFMARSKTFDLFRYDRCLIVNAANLQAARLWTELTTGLTRYEAPAALEHIRLEAVESIIDLGGNTGEFALHLARRAPQAQLTVVDLPVVCELGRQHVARAAQADEAHRIRFFPTDLRGGSLPPPAGLVSFKSVLHDWPEREARELLKTGASLVQPGGRMLIFERAPLNFRRHPFTYALTLDLVFLHFLRPEKLYIDTLEELGFRIDLLQTIELEVDFHLILATRTR